MNHITITGSYYALGRYRCGDILFLPAKTVTFQPLPSDFTVGPYLRRILFYTLARPVYARFARFATPFYPAPFFIMRDSKSLFRDISLVFELYIAVHIHRGFSRRFFFQPSFLSTNLFLCSPPLLRRRFYSFSFLIYHATLFYFPPLYLFSS
jgi:hypothetical protein